jgi:hypothetical protein
LAGPRAGSCEHPRPVVGEVLVGAIAAGMTQTVLSNLTKRYFPETGHPVAI